MATMTSSQFWDHMKERAVKPVLMSFTEQDVETALSELETRYR